ncbi:MAG: serine hydrolase [Rhodothermales bacterium]
MRIRDASLMLLLAGLAAVPASARQTADGDQEMPAVAPRDAGWNTTLLSDLERAIAADSFPQTTSVLVAQGGRLVYEAYFGSGAADLLNDTRSATKSITALAIGRAIDDGLITGVDAPAFAYLAYLAPFANDGDAKRSVTIEDLLTMSSALDCNDNDPESPGNEENMYPLRDWGRWAVDIPVRAGYERDAAGRGPFAYCTAGTLLLGLILERATGERVDRYIDRTWMRPLGIERRQWAQSPTGEYMTGGGLRLRSRDLLRFAQSVLDGGAWHGQRLVSAAWLHAALSEQRVAGAEQGYGYLFWRRTWQSGCGPITAPYMAGNGGNAILILPSLDAVVVVTRQHYGQRGMHQQTIRLLESFVLAAAPCP